MPHVTADTNIYNIYISALHFGGPPRQFIQMARAGRLRLATSPPTRSEIRRVLADKFSWPDDEISDVFSDLDHCTDVFHPMLTLNVIADDPTDDRILECAVAAGLAVIVTGDRHLLQLGAYAGMQVLKVVEFLRLLPI